jgi:hypothetical protein
LTRCCFPSFSSLPTNKNSVSNGSGYNGTLADILYPLFFYQFPECIPNLAIALGISPPNSILRRFTFFVKTSLCGYPVIDMSGYNPNDESGNSSSNDPTSVTRFTEALSLYGGTPDIHSRSPSVTHSLSPALPTIWSVCYHHPVSIPFLIFVLVLLLYL